MRRNNKTVLSVTVVSSDQRGGGFLAEKTLDCLAPFHVGLGMYSPAFIAPKKIEKLYFNCKDDSLFADLGVETYRQASVR